MALANLLDLDEYRVKVGSVDFRGWPALDTDGQEAGWVEDFVVDTQVLLARYVTLALSGLPRTVVLPITRVALDVPNQRVVLVDVTREQLHRLPYLGEPPRGRREGLGEPLFAVFVPESTAVELPSMDPGPVVFLGRDLEDPELDA